MPALALIAAIVQYGVPTVVKLIQTWEIDPDSITEADVKKLLEALPPPESYFNS